MSRVSSLTVYTARSVMSELPLTLPSPPAGARVFMLLLTGVRILLRPLPFGERVGVRGSAEVRVECLDDTLQNAFEILKDVIVPESKHPKTVTFQRGGALGVAHPVDRVLASIELDNKFGLGTAEICDVPADRMLTPKLEAEESTVTEARPQSLFGVGLALPERSRAPHPALSPEGRGFTNPSFKTPSPFQGEGRGEGAVSHREEYWRWAAWSVLRRSIATVMGPTPPGTGVMARALRLADSKSTSPASLPVSRRLIPTSMTTAPSLIISPVTTPALPAATQSTSARRQCSPKSRVRVWHMVTVAWRPSRSWASGLPTRRDRPTTTASAPLSSMP